MHYDNEMSFEAIARCVQTEKHTVCAWTVERVVFPLVLCERREGNEFVLKIRRESMTATSPVASRFRMMFDGAQTTITCTFQLQLVYIAIYIWAYIYIIIYIIIYIYINKCPYIYILQGL